MKIIVAGRTHLDDWINLRLQLWEGNYHTFNNEVLNILQAQDQICYLAHNDQGESVGFIEGKLYQNQNEKYGFVEGWYVIPDLRKKGVGFMLMDALENWFTHQAIEKFYSDTIPAQYPQSTTAHLHKGYKILHNVTVFVKEPTR